MAVAAVAALNAPALAQVADPPLVRGLGTWAEQPDPVEIQAAKPKGVSTTAYAILACRSGADGRLIDCRPAWEDPQGAGVGAAAMSLAPRFRLDPATARIASQGTMHIELRLSWAGKGGNCYPPICTPIPPPPPLGR